MVYTYPSHGHLSSQTQLEGEEGNCVILSEIVFIFSITILPDLRRSTMADNQRFEAFLRAMSSIVDDKRHSMRLKRRESEQLLEERGVWGRESQQEHALVEGQCPAAAIAAMKDLIEEKSWLPHTHRIASEESYRYAAATIRLRAEPSQPIEVHR